MELDIVDQLLVCLLDPPRIVPLSGDSREHSRSGRHHYRGCRWGCDRG